MRVGALTFAGIVAALYGDPEDEAFVASNPWVPTLREIEEALVSCLGAGNTDGAELLREELERLRGAPMRGSTPALCYGSKAGLWRLQ